MNLGVLVRVLHWPETNIRFGALAIANAASVATLYCNQALMEQIAASFPGANYVSLIPMTTLAGYGSGVALIAFGPAARVRASLECHLGFLAMALVAAGSAAGVLMLALASFFVGCGAAVAQPLLAAAAHSVGPAVAGRAIGKVIGGALLAVLAVKLFGADVGQVLGWRSVFFLAAGGAVAAGLLTFITRPAGELPPIATPSGTMASLWRTSPVLRRATLQQAALFAAFNAGWMVALVEIPAPDRPVVVIGGCCAGLVAAMVAGRCTDRRGRLDVAAAGAGAMLVSATVILPSGYGMHDGMLRTLLLLLGMALIDAGLQIALVANQARVQAIRPAIRSRLAASLTVCGSLGGAVGAGIGFWLWRKFGWQAGVGLTALAAGLGMACSVFPAARRRAASGPAAMSADDEKIIYGQSTIS